MSAEPTAKQARSADRAGVATAALSAAPAADRQAARSQRAEDRAARSRLAASRPVPQSAPVACCSRSPTARAPRPGSPVPPPCAPPASSAHLAEDRITATSPKPAFRGNLQWPTAGPRAATTPPSALPAASATSLLMRLDWSCSRMCTLPTFMTGSAHRHWSPAPGAGACRGWRVEVPKHRDRQLWRYRLEEKSKGFQVIPRRWVVERTFAWLSRSRRLARDHEPAARNR